MDSKSHWRKVPRNAPALQSVGAVGKMITSKGYPEFV